MSLRYLLIAYAIAFSPVIFTVFLFYRIQRLKKVIIQIINHFKKRKAKNISTLNRAILHPFANNRKTIFIPNKVIATTHIPKGEKYDIYNHTIFIERHLKL